MMIINSFALENSTKKINLIQQINLIKANFYFKMFYRKVVYIADYIKPNANNEL